MEAACQFYTHHEITLAAVDTVSARCHVDAVNVRE
jgi:hypothetical protein